MERLTLSRVGCRVLLPGRGMFVANGGPPPIVPEPLALAWFFTGPSGSVRGDDGLARLGCCLRKWRRHWRAGWELTGAYLNGSNTAPRDAYTWRESYVPRRGTVGAAEPPVWVGCLVSLSLAV